MKQSKVKTLRTLAAVLSLATAVTAHAQHPDSAACATILSAPTRDSVTIDVRIGFRSLDADRKIPESYASLLATGMRQFLRFPRGLALDTYLAAYGPSAHTYLVAEGFYAASLTTDGHVKDAHVIGASTSEAFDDAIMTSLEALDSSGDMPPLPPSMARIGTDLPIVMEIASGDPLQTGRHNPAGATFLLFRYRTPPRAVTKALEMTYVPKLGYADDYLRDAMVDSVRARMVVDPRGKVDGRSIRAESYTDVELMNAFVRALPLARFEALQVEGCAVRAIVTQPISLTVLHH